MRRVIYKKDEHLEFLRDMKSSELAPLVNHLIYTPKGAQRDTQQLSCDRNDFVKRDWPEHSKYWEEIAGEIQHKGANTFSSMWRTISPYSESGGVLYEEVLRDVCSKLDTCSKSTSVWEMENRVMASVLTTAMKDMTDADRATILEALDIKDKSLKGPALLAAIQFVFTAGGFASYKIAIVLAHGAFNFIGKPLLGAGLPFAAGKKMTQSLKIASGPIGWVITAAWAAYTVSGPAMRITIPACVHISYLRRIYAMRESETRNAIPMARPGHDYRMDTCN